MKLQIFMKKNSKLNSNRTCLVIIILAFALKKIGSYYLQAFLKECKYIEKKKVVRYINENCSDFSSFDESDEE